MNAMCRPREQYMRSLVPGGGSEIQMEWSPRIVWRLIMCLGS